MSILWEDTETLVGQIHVPMQNALQGYIDAAPAAWTAHATL